MVNAARGIQKQLKPADVRQTKPPAFGFFKNICRWYVAIFSILKESGLKKFK